MSQKSSSNLFPDLDILSSIPVVTTQNTTVTNDSKDLDLKHDSAPVEGETDLEEEATTAKKILLKYKCMPLYPVARKSREQLDSFLERYKNVTGKDWLSNIGQAGETETRLSSSTIREYAVILHSLFSEFCTPRPSIASVYRIVMLESTRVASLKGRGIHQSTLVSDDTSDYAKDLPKEPLVHTTISSAQFVIALLRSPSIGCLLALPLEFLLSFLRLLVRLLSEEDDQEYDDECLFDWSFDADNQDASRTDQRTDQRKNNKGDACGVKKDANSDSELDNSYHVVQRGVSVSSNNQSPAVDPAVSSSRKSEVRQSNSAADIVTQAWAYGSWKKKKSSPLYSTIRFCSNLAWDGDDASDLPSQATPNFKSRVSQRQRWNFVADNVRLDEAEEEELNKENVFEEGRSNGSMKLLGTLINLYQSILGESHKESRQPCFKYLLLGPIAHLLGLVVSAVGLSVKDLRKLLIIADGSDSSSIAVKQSSRKLLMSGNPTTQITQQFSLHLGRLHIIRMMRYAAEYSTQSTGILDKVGPQSFFSFGDGGDGLSATLENKHWPFKHDFGMACWFRAETFVRASFRGGSGNKNQDSLLFRARTQDGGQIEVSFESCSGGTDDIFTTAATLLVTITDAHSPDVQKTPRKVRLVGCVLSPLVWYHVAVRLTKSKSSPFTLNKTNELSIFVNGKMMLRTQMKLPRFLDSTNGGLSGSLASIGLGSLSRPVSNGDKKSSPIEFTFFSHIDGQAGALYIFDELVSDETIKLLYTSTSSQSEQGSTWFTFSDGWDVSRSKLAHIAKALSSASMLSELEDIVLPDYPILIGTVPRKTKTLIDMPEEELNPSAPAGLSKSNFGSKIFLVWDPSRIRNQTVVDIHSRIDVILPNHVSSWSFEEGIKDTLFSLGGPKRLIPVFSILTETATLHGQNRHFKMKGIHQDFPNIFTPNIMFLVSSFIREHTMNGRELYRCGGIHVMHKIFHECKQRQLECSSGAYYGMGASSVVGKYNVSALLDLWHSSRQVFGLEITVFSQLLFNTHLLFGGVSTCDVYLHTYLLPVLSYITRQNPEKVRDCVGTSACFDCIREYSRVENDEEVMDNQELPELYVPFQRPQFCVGTSSHLTSLERRIVVDFLLGMVATMLTNSCPANDLSPLVTFLTHNLDSIRQHDKQNTKNVPADNSENRSKQPSSSCDYGSRYFATLKAAHVLFFLLQKSPPIPHIIESLTSLLENANGVASWVLCSMVNQYDDNLRGLGIRCLVAYLHSTLDFTTGGSRDDGSTVKLSYAVKYGLGVISSSSNVLTSLLAGRGNVKVIYKLLFHLLKCHRERLGEHSNSGLMYLLVDDSSIDVKQCLSLSDLVVETKAGGIRLDIENLDISQSKLNIAATLSRQNIRNVYGVSALMRLMRFMSNEQKERWLFDLLALTLASSGSISVILSCEDWQPCLFQLVAEVLEEINEDIPDKDTANSDVGRSQDVRKFDIRALSKPSVRTRYDLSLKLYSSLLGHCVRKGDDKAFAAVEIAASLQRVDVNGPDVFGIVLSHLLADLIEKGTVESVEDTYEKEPPSVKNRALKQSARLVTQAVLANGSGSNNRLDMAAAVKQWRSLRHLTALATAVVTDFGFGITELFDYQLQDAAATDAITGGLYGIRLGDNLVSGINAFEALASAQLYSRDEKGSKRNTQDRHRYVSVVLASQVLTLLDAFIFPDNLDSSTSATQLHGLSLVRSSEPRLGQSQGPLLASLVRLSLILLHFLEPCSVRFLQACSRLRCFLHWALEIIRESVALGGYSVAYHDLTAPFDRVVLVTVLHCHRALSRCSTLLVEIESSPWDKYFADVESRQKSHRRLFRAILELREIVLAAYRGRNEVLRASLSPQAHDALSRGLEGGELLSPKKPSDPSKNLISREENIRTFLVHDWVTGFHDVQTVGSTILPDSIGTTIGKEAFLTLASESMSIINDYKTVMNAPWKGFCEHQRKWAETDAVREMEHSGDLIIKKLASKERSDALESNKLMVAGLALASSRFSTMLQLAREPWAKAANWQFSCFTDLLFRRIVFSRIVDFDDHRFASYELTLGKDREHLQEEEKLKREEEIKAALIQAGEAIVPYQVDDEVEEEDLEDNFVGWNDQNGDTPGGDDGIPEPASIASNTTDTRDNKSDLDWDQLDFDDTTTDNSDPYLWAKRFVWSEGETFIRTFDSVLLVTLRSNTKGTLLLSSHNLYFHQTGEVIDVMTREKVDIPTQDKKWKLNRLTDIHGRRYMLKGQALELFFADMRGVFIAFDGSKERDLFFMKLRTNCRAPLLRPLKSLNPRTIFKKSKITELWRKRKLNNFQYIMALNLMAGRTFNDITQYPVFPWILADYTSEEIDLKDQKIYRDLSKPVGALNPDRLASLIERFNELDGFPEEEKFLYGSHYSSPGVVLHYMVRQEPFTSMHIALQSGRFDCPDRLFFDVAGCWRSCLSSTSDVKELTPEFFTCPEIFVNTNSFPLGETQNKTPVDNVILPPWAKGSAHEFVRIHQMALESEYVSNNLHYWIDLIFGYKQRGPESAAAHNIFHYLSYEGAVDIDKITDEVQRSAIEGHIQNFGQTPSQLIVKDPHPPRLHADPIPCVLFPETSTGYDDLQCSTPSKQFGDQRYNEAAGAIVSLQLQGDSIFAIHSDYTLCSYKLYPSRGTIPFQFKHDRARKIDSRTSYMVQSSSPDMLDGTSSVVRSDFSQMSTGFALAKGGSEQADEPSSGIMDVSFFLMSIGYYDNSVKVHSIDSLQLHSSVNGVHRGHINCIQASVDGTVVVTGGHDGTCTVWVVDYEDFAASIADGVVQPGQEGSHDDFLKCCHVLLGHTTPITCIAISTKLDIVVSGSQDGSICLHNIRSGRFVRSLHVNAVTQNVENSCASNAIPVSKLVIHSDGIFVAHLYDGSLHVITVNGHRLVHTQAGEMLNSILICPQSNTLITGGEHGLARMWNLHDLTPKCTVDVSKYGQITSMVLVPSENSSATQFLCVGSENGLLSIVFRNP